MGNKELFELAHKITKIEIDFNNSYGIDLPKDAYQSTFRRAKRTIERCIKDDEPLILIYPSFPF